jgi:hypothetical protein
MPSDSRAVRFWGRRRSRREFLSLAAAAAGAATLGGATGCTSGRPAVGPATRSTAARTLPTASPVTDISAPMTVFVAEAGAVIFHGGVGVMPDGRWLLVYMDRTPGVSRSAVYGRWSSDEGRTYGLPFPVSVAGSPLIDPTVLVANGGTIIVQYHTRLQAERARIRQVVSSDGGLTWTDPLLAPVVAGRGTSEDFAWEPILLSLADGTILSFFSLLSAEAGLGRTKTHVAVIRSMDQGSTWSGPTMIRDLGRQTGQIRNVGMQSSDGRVLCFYATWEDDPDQLVHQIKCSYSTDAGRTWNRGSGRGTSDVVAAMPGVDMLVPWPVEMDDGRIRVAFVATFPSSNGRQIWVVDSNDGGATWGPPTVANRVTNAVGRPVIQAASDAYVMYEVGLIPVHRYEIVYQLLARHP